MGLQFDMFDMRLVIHVAEMNSLTGGAEKVFLSLPAASTRLKRLEESLGLKLFNRTTQGLTLTPAGRVVVRHSQQINRQLEQMCGELHPFVHGLKGSLRIAASTAAATDVLPMLLPAFLAAYPDVDVDVSERSNVDIVRAVSEGSADIGLVSGTVTDTGLDMTPFAFDRLVLVCSTAHELSGCHEIGFAQTLAYDQVALKPGSALTQFLTKSALDLQSSLRLRTTVGDFVSICRIAEANAAVGILPESVARRHAQSMRIDCVRLSDDWASQTLSLAVKDPGTLPNFASGFIDMMLGVRQLREAA